MSAPFILTPARREDLRCLLLRGARDGRVDLGNHTLPNWASIDGFLLDAQIAPEDLAALTAADIEAIRVRLAAAATVRERFEAFLEWMDEAGLASALLLVAIILALAWFFYSCLTLAHAGSQDLGPEPSSVGGLLVLLIPVGIAVAFLTFATRGRTASADDEAFGDTTGFGESDR